MPFKENQHSRNLLSEVSEIEFIGIKIQIFQCHLFIIHKNVAQRAIKILLSQKLEERKQMQALIRH